VGNEPRVRRPPAGSAADRRGASLEEREVRSADPELSEDTNQRLTEELREAVGADHVVVPSDRPHTSEGEHEQQPGMLAYLNQNRLTFMRSGLIALTFGAIVALITNTWWLLPLAAGIHALGTMSVVFGSLHLTTLSEHPSPTLAAQLAEEGISSTDEHFSRLVEEFQPEPSATTAEVATPNANRRTTSASTDPARAAAEQSGAMTPTAEPSEPAESGALPDYMNWALIAGLAIVCLVIPPVAGGGWMWLLPAVVLPTLGLWAFVQWALEFRPELVHRRSPALVAAITLGITVAVAAFCAVVAIGLQSS
jgi:hypothetical protein